MRKGPSSVGLLVLSMLLLASRGFGQAPLGTGGACCLFGGACDQVADVAACNAQGGVFLAGADCAADACGVGACCADETCTEFPAYPCITSGREFAGAGTTCADDPCVIGVGACCIVGTCSILEENACAAAGGAFQGPGANCVQDPCDLGACCLPGACVDNARYQCDPLGGTLVVGGTCAADGCAVSGGCDLDALFGQSPDGPDDFEAQTSEASSTFLRFEDFAGVAGPIVEVKWWGVEAAFSGTFTPCTEVDPTFTIAFHEDAGGQPGALACSYKETVTRTPTGILYLGIELVEYSVTLPSPCVLTNGWVSVVGLGDPSCWFVWMSAGPGFSWCDGCGSSMNDFDLAVCLDGTAGGVAGACCTEAAGTCADGVDIADCTAIGQVFTPGTLCAELVPGCGVITGACCQSGNLCTTESEDDCTVLGGVWLGADTLCDLCPCTVTCPPGATPEGEPVCGPDYVDLFNGGCNAALPTFSSIALGQTVCAQSGVFPSGGDNIPEQDWYELTLAAPILLDFEILAEFPAAAFVVDGSAGCPGTVVTSASTTSCTTLSLLAPVGPGTVWLVVRPTGFVDEAVCGATYVATTTNLSACAEDLDGNGVVGFADLNLLLASWGPCAGCAADLDRNDVVGFADLNLLLARWGPCAE